jgi:hypothetical protein
LEAQLGYFGVGLHNPSEVPEADQVLEVVGQIEGRPAKILLVQLLMSTTEHPQTDGQAEAAVKVIQKLLRPFVFQGQDWEELLPTLEFTYNDTTQSSTGQTPFTGIAQPALPSTNRLTTHTQKTKYNTYCVCRKLPVTQ